MGSFFLRLPPVVVFPPGGVVGGVEGACTGICIDTPSA
jgi:hypothetical protein